MSRYTTALKASFARIYADRSIIEAEAEQLARRFPERCAIDYTSGLMGYRLTVYFNIRDFLGATHEEALLCVDLRDEDANDATGKRVH